MSLEPVSKRPVLANLSVGLKVRDLRLDLDQTETF